MLPSCLLLSDSYSHHNARNETQRRADDFHMARVLVWTEGKLLADGAATASSHTSSALNADGEEDGNAAVRHCEEMKWMPSR